MEVWGLGQLKELNLKLRNKMANTEKPTIKAEQKKQEIVNTSKSKAELNKTPMNKPKGEPSINKSEKSDEPTGDESKLEEKKGQEKKKPIQKKPVIKKTKAIVNSFNIPISTKHSTAICRFIKNKKIENAMADLEQVLIHKKTIPMKGEIPHRKGKRIMSGRYPKKATEYFIKLLKNLLANANINELDNPVITEAVANIGSRPFGRFGSIRKKRTHVKIKAEEKLISKEGEKKWKKEI